MKKILFALSAFALVLTSCDKDDEDKSEVTTKNIAGAYKLESMKLQMGTGGGPEMDLMQQMPACQVDDIQTLAVNGTYTYADAGTKCNPPGDDTGTWSLPSTTSIILDGDPYTIKSFDGDKLTISDTYTDQGVTYTITVVMDKQ